MAAPPLLRDRLSFLQRLPVLLKGTSDDEAPCPGYLLEEIAKISHESLGSSQCLLEYLLSRLQRGSGHVKLKVLKILLYLCSHGSSSFLFLLQRNSFLVQEAAGLWEDETGKPSGEGGSQPDSIRATGFTGPPDPLHGNSLYQKVRVAAQDLGSTLFSDALSPLPSHQPPRPPPPAGMGPQTRPHSALQGFGYSKERGRLGSAGGSLLTTIQRAAEMVASAVRPGPIRPTLRDDTYQPAVPPAASLGAPTPGEARPGAAPGARAVRHQPGRAGGGWEEADGGPGSQSSSQEDGDTGSRSSSDGHSGASRELGDLAERVEAVALSDCRREASLVGAVTQGPRAFLTRDEIQRFLRECGLLNCEAVLELLLRQLGGPSECTQLRALSAISSLGGADLLAQEHVLVRARPQLQTLSVGRPGPVASKATKILRHLEASCRPQPPPQRPLAEPGPLGPATVDTCAGLSDLLTDTEPFAGGQTFLRPLSSFPCSPEGAAGPLQPSLHLDGSPVSGPSSDQGSTREAEARLAGSGEQGPRPGRDPSGTELPNGGLERGVCHPGCPWTPVADRSSRSSLFAGMELVSCPCPVGAGAAAEKPVPPDPAPRAAPGSELSAFAFLNA